MPAMTGIGKTVLRVALGSFALLMVPLVASRVVEGWHWGPGAFVFTYCLFFATGMMYSLIARRMNVRSYRAAVALVLTSGFVMGWATMVHLSETENPVLLVYFGVLAIGAVGAALARLQARGLARTAFVMAAAMILALILTQTAPGQRPDGPFWNIAIAHGGMAAVFVTAGLLFRHASRSAPPL